LPDCSGEADPRLATLLQDQALDLVAIALSTVMTASGTNVSSPRAVAYLRLRSALNDHLTDAALSPTSLAKAARMSVRHANHILRDHDTSLERFIQKARLERCRRAFCDPAQSRRTITEIALGWGFSDATLFSRVFKRTYGVTPRDYRRQRCERI
jgi:AraC-like DNA-binding protein